MTILQESSFSIDQTTIKQPVQPFGVRALLSMEVTSQREQTQPRFRPPPPKQAVVAHPAVGRRASREQRSLACWPFLCTLHKGGMAKGVGSNTLLAPFATSLANRRHLHALQQQVIQHPFAALWSYAHTPPLWFDTENIPNACFTGPQ